LIPGLSPKQIQKLLSLIETPKPRIEKLSGNIAWMFDSRASCHMTGGPKMMHETKKISSISVALPNGTHTIANDEGSMTLGQRIQLHKVLYVPSLKCNLISVAKLCKELNCNVTFFDIFVYCRIVF